MNKRMKIIGWRAKVKGRQEWNRIVERTKTYVGGRRRRRNKRKRRKKKKKIQAQAL